MIIEFTATTTPADEQDLMDLLITAEVPIVPALPVRMTTRKVAGYCAFCGCAKWLPPFPVNEIAPRPEVVCGHTSD